MKTIKHLWEIFIQPFTATGRFVREYWIPVAFISFIFIAIFNPMMNQCTRHEARYYRPPYGMKITNEEALLLDEVKNNPWITTPKWTTRSWFKYPKVYDVVKVREKKFERRQDSIKEAKEKKVDEKFQKLYEKKYEAEEVEEPVVPKPKEIKKGKTDTIKKYGL